MAWSEVRYADRQALAQGLADTLVQLSGEALNARGQAWLCLAGGRTPQPAYRALAAAALDFSRIAAIPGDERCVPHDHPACNLRALREAFADTPHIQLHSLTVADGSRTASEAHAQAVLAAHAQDFDVTLLGMGKDGHSASIFPGAAEAARALALDAAVDALATTPDPLPPEAPFDRITLTLPRLLRSRRLLLAVSGEDKRALLNAVQAGEHAQLPIAHLLQHPQARVQIHFSP